MRHRLLAFSGCALLLLSLLLYIPAAWNSAVFACSDLTVTEYALSTETAGPGRWAGWLPLLPALLLAAALAVGVWFALRRSRPAGIAAAALCTLSGLVYWLLPSQLLAIGLYSVYRFSFGMNWIPLVERAPWAFPLFRWVYLGGLLLLAAALLLAVAVPAPSRGHQKM